MPLLQPGASFKAAVSSGAEPAAQRMDHRRDRRGIRAAADPDREGLISSSMMPLFSAPSGVFRRRRRCRGERSGGVHDGVTTAGTNVCGSGPTGIATGCRICRRHVNSCCGDHPCRRATSDTTAPRGQRLLDEPRLVVGRELPASAALRDDLAPTNRGPRLKHMVKLRHKPISNPRSIIPRSTPSMEGGTETALTIPRLQTSLRCSRYKVALAPRRGAELSDFRLIGSSTGQMLRPGRIVPWDRSAKL